MPKHAYSLLRPKKRRSSVVFASPHSGNDYPEWFVRQSVLDAQLLRSSEDAFVDKVFAAVPEFGAPLLLAEAPRAFIDYNRGMKEMDPAAVEGVPKGALNPRIASGLGVIPRVVAGGRAIFRGKLSEIEAKRRIDHYWKPYHARLQSLLQESHDQFGEAILIDCHSMPHEALEGLIKANARRPDIVLGDRFGAAADNDVVEQIEAAFSSAGFLVVRNAPFAGAFVSQHYGRPSRRQHAIQIEIDRGLYMDESRIEPLPDFADFCQVMRAVIAEITEIGVPENQSMAAE